MLFSSKKLCKTVNTSSAVQFSASRRLLKTKKICRNADEIIVNAVTGGGGTELYGLFLPPRLLTDIMPHWGRRSKVQTPAGGPVFAMLRRGEQYCEQLASFTRKEPRDPASLHYAATRHTFVLDPASFHYAVTSRRGRRYTTPWRAILRGKVAFCKANKRGIRLRYTTP